MNKIVRKIYLHYLKRKNEIMFYREMGVKIGEGCHFYNVQIDVGHAFLCAIGNNCTLTNCRILTHDASTYSLVGKSRCSVVMIGDNCFIGLGSIILPGVHIGNNCIIGAGTVVTKSVPDNSVVVGNPGKVVKSRECFNDEIRKQFFISPKYDTYWKNKSESEKSKMFSELSDKFGYDK